MRDRSPKTLAAALIAASKVAETEPEKAKLLDATRQAARRFGSKMRMPVTDETKVVKAVAQSMMVQSPTVVFEFVVEELENGNERSVGNCRWLMPGTYLVDTESMTDVVIDNAWTKELRQVFLNNAEALLVAATLSKIDASLDIVKFFNSAPFINANAEMELLSENDGRLRERLANALEELVYLAKGDKRLQLLFLANRLSPDEENYQTQLDEILFDPAVAREDRVQVLAATVGLTNGFDSNGKAKSWDQLERPIAPRVETLLKLITVQCSEQPLENKRPIYVSFSNSNGRDNRLEVINPDRAFCVLVLLRSLKSLIEQIPKEDPIRNQLESRASEVMKGLLTSWLLTDSPSANVARNIGIDSEIELWTEPED